jgi:hypothetical protein
MMSTMLICAVVSLIIVWALIFGLSILQELDKEDDDADTQN